MKFIIDLLKLLLVILPLVGKMLHTNYKRKNIDEKDIFEEDNALFEEKETPDNSDDNNNTSDNSNISNPEI